MARVRKALTFSNVVACVALFVALGGSVYAAGKISGKQIRKGSLPGNRVKPKTLTARQIKPKTLTGRQVRPKSLTGRQINQKTLTAIVAAGLASVHYEATTMPVPAEGPAATATANCPSGSYAIGGGATVGNDDVGRVTDSGPTSSRTGWTATAFSWPSGTTVTVTAVCVPVSRPGGADNTVPGPPANPKGPVYVPFG